MAELFVLGPEDFKRWQRKPGREGFPPPIQIDHFGGADLEYALKRHGIDCIVSAHPEWVAMRVTEARREDWIASLCKDFGVTAPSGSTTEARAQ